MGNFFNRPIGTMNILEFFLTWFVVYLIVAFIFWAISSLFNVPENRRAHLVSPFYLGGKPGGYGYGRGGMGYGAGGYGSKMAKPVSTYASPSFYAM